MKNPRLWIISPVYHDVESYLILRREILDVLHSLAEWPLAQIEFVAVDDTGGLDREIDRLRPLSDVTVIEPPFNLGHQRALVHALRHLAEEIADHDFVVTLDADGEDLPADLPRLLAPLLANLADTRKISLAWRTRRRESLPFKVLYFFFRLLFRSLTGIVVRSGNYAAYRGWFARRLLFHPHFDLCYSSAFLSLNLRIDFVPASRGVRYAGRSRMSYSKLLIHGISMLLPFTDRIAIRALIAFALAFGLSSVTLAAAVAVRLFSATPVPVWAAVFSLITSILSFIAMGNLILLFATFSQSRGTSLRNLERENRERAGISSAASN